MNHQEELEEQICLRGDLDAKEQRDHELIKEHLNEAPGYIENDRRNVRTKNSPRMMASGVKKQKSTPEILWIGEKRNI